MNNDLKYKYNKIIIFTPQYFQTIKSQYYKDYIINQQTNSTKKTMSINKQKLKIDSLKYRQNKLSHRKSIPLPTLSLQTKQFYPKQKYQHKIIKQTKCIVRQNFKKALEILNQLKKKGPFVPSNFQNITADRSKQTLRKKSKTNFQFYNPKISPIIFKQQIIESIQKINQYQLQNSQRQIRFNTSKLKILNRSIKIGNNKKKAETIVSKPKKCIKWQNFCTSVSYVQRKSNILPTVSVKQRVSKKNLINKRSKSTFSLINQNEQVKGWEEKPIRYQTDYDHIEDFCDFCE